MQFRGSVDVETLQQEADRLKNAVKHLESSNAEVQEAIREGDDDSELHAALEVRDRRQACIALSISEEPRSQTVRTQSGAPLFAGEDPDLLHRRTWECLQSIRQPSLLSRRR